MNQLISKIAGVAWITLFLICAKQEKPWKDVTHSNYSFSYPPEWDLEFQHNSSNGFTLRLSGSKYPPEIELLVYHFPHRLNLHGLSVNFGDVESLSELKAPTTLLDSIQSDSTSIIPVSSNLYFWKRIDIDTISNDGQSYIEAIHQFEKPNETYKRIWRVYDKGFSRYNLKFQCKIKDWDTYESDVLKVFNSFKLK